MALAVVFFIVGVILLFIPGPAFVFLGISLGMAADHSRTVARVLDWGEVKARFLLRKGKTWWKGASALARSGIVGTAGLVVGLAGYLAWQFLLPN